MAEQCPSFADRTRCFLQDRYGAAHFLRPVLDFDSSAFFTNGDDEIAQRMWAREQGLPAKTSLEDILLAQIEAHQTEVLYNLDPVRYPSRFVARLPGCVKKSIAWRAAPSKGADFRSYDRVVCNFPSILEAMTRDGCKTAYFAPAHDPAMNPYAAVHERPIDVTFVGGYSRHHRQRGLLLESVAQLADKYKIVLHLDASRLTRLAESFLGQILPLAAHRRPQGIRQIARRSVFGVDLYRVLSQSKIVLNGAIDMAGQDRGNMRCFEGLGCGALLLSDEGRYPAGIEQDRTAVFYSNPQDATAKIAKILGSWDAHSSIAKAGFKMVSESYSKEQQWDHFLQLLN